MPDCTTTQRKFSPAVKYPLFRCSVYLFWVATVFFLFSPCTHSGQVEQASMVLRRRPFHHKDDDAREALPATLSSPKFSWSSSEIWTIFTSSRMISFDHPPLSGPKQGLSVDSLFLISFMPRKRRRSREGGRRKKNKPKRHQSVPASRHLNLSSSSPVHVLLGECKALWGELERVSTSSLLH